MPGTRLDRQLLQATAAESGSMTQFLEALGMDTGPRTRKNMQARLARAGISTANWRRSRRLTYSSEDLAEAVRRADSMAGVLRLLGVAQAGGSQSYLAQRIRQEGLSTAHFTGQAHGRGAVKLAHAPEAVLVVLPADARRRDTKRLRQALLAIGRSHTCAVCGLGPRWLDRPLTLVIDHVDGNWLDNRPANVRFLCPNCHAQTSNWCRRKVSGP